eukprot:2393241-Prorocentrum_lima.AAC.1
MPQTAFKAALQVARCENHQVTHVRGNHQEEAGCRHHSSHGAQPLACFVAGGSRAVCFIQEALA